tara:strand:- start:3611 stop:6583 length:2973 start_codon:yes stop_codon:yes gene_type:complete
MSVKSFKFVSPGVFIHEIDNSTIPKKADIIGPVIIGRARRGLSMTPTKVESYSQFVEMFGDTVPGNTGGDVYREGNDMQSPMYGTYAAKAFLRANVAPITYIRLLGQQHDNATTGYAGWKTDNFLGDATAGGAYGLFVAKSASAAELYSGIAGYASDWAFTGSNSLKLAAIWYNDVGGIALSGTMFGQSTETSVITGSLLAGTLIVSDSTGRFTAVISGSNTDSGVKKKVTFNFDDTSEAFIRKQFNTNPQLRAGGDFYRAADEVDWWLGETFEQEMLDAGLTSGNLVGVITGIQLDDGTDDPGPANMYNKASRAAQTGWFIGQDLGAAEDFNPETSPTRLFRLIGRGHGEWLQRSVKVSIENIRASTSLTNDYGTFSVVLRALNDTDNNQQVMERFDNLNMNPVSPDFICRRIGTKYTKWNTAGAQAYLEEVGVYPNMSKFIYVDPTSACLPGGKNKTLLPFGYWGPPKFTDVTLNCGTGSGGARTRVGWSPDNYYVFAEDLLPDWTSKVPDGRTGSDTTISGGVSISASLAFPAVRLRVSASDGALSDPTEASFGMQTTRTSGSTVALPGVGDCHRLWSRAMPTDPAATTATGIDKHAYIFTLDNIVSSSTGNYFYRSGSRTDETSISAQAGSTYKTLLNAGYDSFTAPIWGAFDGFDIRVPDPMYNAGMDDSSTTTNNYVFWTWRRAIDTVADPEFVDMNLLAAPGLTNASLTTTMVRLTENRGDSLSIIDLPSVYLPRAEGSYATRPTAGDRVATTPQQAADALIARGIDSSYGATFYPWVQTRDDSTGQLVWIPPTVAMCGVLASSEKKAAVWFAPAGFNRGGLTEGAAGISVTGVTERLTSKQRDTLYASNINPIASFPSTGIVVFGQKTLQSSQQSALDRINVRRLVIYLKKQISILSTKVLFEQNVSTTWAKFKALIEPLLANVKTQYGITDYKLILDETTTTDDLIDQNIMYAKIMIKPARAIEFIAIDFVIASTGASFDD